MMLKRRRIGIIGGSRYDAYVRSLRPALWFRLNEPSGISVVNSGLLGGSYNGTFTPGAGAVGQVGAFGPCSAYLFDGVDSKIEVPGGANNYTQFTYTFLVHPTSAGELNYGALADINGGAGLICSFNGNLNSLTFFRDATGNDATTTTITGLTAGEWSWVIATFDLLGDKKVHLYKGKSSALIEYAYSTQVAVTGTLVDLSASPLCIGNRDTQNVTFNGLYGTAALYDRVLTNTQLEQMIGLSAV